MILFNNTPNKVMYILYLYRLLYLHTYNISANEVKWLLSWYLGLIILKEILLESDKNNDTTLIQAF